MIRNICVFCHRSGSLAGGTAMVFQAGQTAQVEQANLAVLDTYVLSMGGQWLLDKAQGLNNHGGGQQITSGTEPYTVLVDYLTNLTGNSFSVSSVKRAAHVTEPATATYRRASLLLTGTIPSSEKLATLANLSDKDLRTQILGLMQGEGFHEFIKRGANDQLLVRSLKSTRILLNDLNDYYPVFNDTYNKTGTTDYNYAVAVMNELAEAPLELIAYVVENNRPYTEVLTADHTMVSSRTASIFKTDVSPVDGEFVPAVNQGQHISGINRSYPRIDWGASLQVRLPHAGILTEPAFLQQYPTTPTNRNRARARWTFMHFLGFDIEASAARTISASALQDVDNPTLNNEACTVCHKALDPVAGAFQNFYVQGIYRAGPYGLDSLDHAYRASKLYKKGDTWYADMLAPGFGDDLIGERDASLQQLAQYIVADPRFAQAAVKFWWPAIFGEHFFGQNLTGAQFDAKSQTLSTLSEDFKQSNYNLRELLADMLMSDWFRAERLQEAAPAGTESVLYTGGKRLLTPEELASKTVSVAGVADKQLVGGMSRLYGGIDSVSVDVRQRDFSHVMSRVAERHALSSACKIVATEFNTPRGTRKLFTLVERGDLPGTGYAASTTLSSTDTTRIAHSAAVDLAPGQVLHFVATQLVMANESYSANTVTIEKVEVIEPDGSVLISGNMADVYQQYDWITGNPISATISPYRIRRGYDLKLDIPVTQSGTYQIVLIVKAQAAGALLDVKLTPEVYLASAKDTNTQRIRDQISVLLERMHGRALLPDSAEVLEYTQLFLDLRANNLRRSAPANLVETNIRCDYDSGGVARSVWGADPNHTLTAWRGLITALMTDFDYLFE